MKDGSGRARHHPGPPPHRPACTQPRTTPARSDGLRFHPSGLRPAPRSCRPLFSAHPEPPIACSPIARARARPHLQPRAPPAPPRPRVRTRTKTAPARGPDPRGIRSSRWHRDAQAPPRRAAPPPPPRSAAPQRRLADWARAPCPPLPPPTPPPPPRPSPLPPGRNSPSRADAPPPPRPRAGSAPARPPHPPPPPPVPADAGRPRPSLGSRGRPPVAGHTHHVRPLSGGCQAFRDREATPDPSPRRRRARNGASRQRRRRRLAPTEQRPRPLRPLPRPPQAGDRSAIEEIVVRQAKSRLGVRARGTSRARAGRRLRSDRRARNRSRALEGFDLTAVAGRRAVRGRPPRLRRRRGGSRRRGTPGLPSEIEQRLGTSQAARAAAREDDPAPPRRCRRGPHRAARLEGVEVRQAQERLPARLDVGRRDLPERRRPKRSTTSDARTLPWAIARRSAAPEPSPHSGQGTGEGRPRRCRPAPVGSKTSSAIGGHGEHGAGSNASTPYSPA
jgi:hypothetical protein